MTKDSPHPAFGPWLRRHRQYMGFSRSELARRINYSVDALKKVESEVRVPSEVMARLLAAHLEVPETLREAFVRFARTGQWERSLESLNRRMSQRVLGRSKRNLPTLRLPALGPALIGRSVLVDHIRALLDDPSIRLITLHGPPGVGKSRLAIEIAWLSRGYYQDGVCFVNLSSVKQVMLLPSAIAMALEIPDFGDQAADADDVPMAAALKLALQDKDLLLVLDNFEHLLAGAMFIEDLLANSPALKVVVTSREPLGIGSDHAVAVGPLALPSVDQKNESIDTLLTYPAVRLFVQRAQELPQANFALTRANIDAVVDACQLTDGLPLAIEVLAAQTAEHSLSLLLDIWRINQQLRSAATSQLQRAIERSYYLLNHEERRVLQVLSLFPAGTEHDMLWQTLYGGNANETDFQTLQPTPASLLMRYALSSLVTKNLVRREQVIGQPNRYTMLATVREFGWNQFKDQPYAAEMLSNSINSYVGFTARAETGLRGQAQLTWLNRIDYEINNIRAVLLYCVDQSTPFHLTKGLQLALQVSAYLALRDLWEERRHWLADFIGLCRACEGVPTTLKDLALCEYVAAHRATLKVPVTVDEMTAALQRFQALEDGFGVARCQMALGDILTRAGDYAAAQQAFATAATYFSTHGHDWHHLNVLRQQSQIERLLGNWDEMMQLDQAIFALSEKLGSAADIALALAMQAATAEEAGDYDRALGMAEQAVHLQRQLRHQTILAWTLPLFANVLSQCGQLGRAQLIAEEAVALSRKLVMTQIQVYALLVMGGIASMQNRFSEAKQYHQAGIELCVSSQNQPMLTFHIIGMVWVALTNRQWVSAAQLAGAATNLLSSPGSQRDLLWQQRLDQCVAELRHGMGGAECTAAMAQGKALGTTELIALALQ